MSAPAREQHKNRSSTTLSGAINSSVTAITVADGSVFPAVGNFRLMCESEIIVCTARSGNSLTVSRGQDGTTAASHSDATTISMIYSQQGLTRLFQDSDGLFGYSGRPPVGLLVDDDGITTLDSSDFTWVNQGGATVTDRGGTATMRVPIDAGINIRALERTAPATPYTYIAAMRGVCLADSDAHPSIGIGFRESSSGKMLLLRYNHASFFASGAQIAVTRMSSASAHFTTPLFHVFGHMTDYVWFKIEADGTNLKLYVGVDGVEWVQVYSEAKGAFFNSEPDRVHWFGMNQNNTVGGGSSQAKATELISELAHWSKGE